MHIRKYILAILLLLCCHTGIAQPVKYVAEMGKYLTLQLKTLPLDYYYDYNEALAAGKRLNKPVMVYFTGLNCVNCRKMEAEVWKKNGVVRRLKDDFVIALLYCDANTIKIPVSEHHFSKTFNRKIDALGWANCSLQESVFHSNSQPTYYFVDGSGKLLIKDSYHYDPDVTGFMVWLDKGSAAYKKKKS